jgi:hypothetical protein
MTKNLIFQFDGKKLKVELSETEVKKFSAKSIFLDKEASDWKIENSFFDKSSEVPDIFRYVLKYTSTSVWKFFDTNKKDVHKFEIDKDQKVIPTEDSKNIILLLESPHKDEYEIKDDKLAPRSPASGDSGRAIYDFFTSHVLPMLNSLGLELNNSTEYNFCIVNPVPYQTSLVNIHQEGLISSLRDKIWKAMYPKLKEDFKSRLEGYRPFVILNGCTSNLKDLLKPEINQITNSKVYNVNHPASWQRSLSGFKIPEK